MKVIRDFLVRMLPRFDWFKLILTVLILALNVTFLRIVMVNNEFSLAEPLVLVSFACKIIFDIALIMAIVFVLKAIFRIAWPAAAFLTIYLLLSIANIILYHFGNTMLEGHHFAMIEPYAVTFYIAWWKLLLILAAIFGAVIPFAAVVKRIDPANLWHQSISCLVVMVLVTLVNTSGFFEGKDDAKHDRVITGFRNAQIYYATKNQMLSLLKDVAFPAVGRGLRALSPETENFVDDYNMISDRFELVYDISKHRDTVESWKLPFFTPAPPDTGLKPFGRVIYIFTESLSLDALPCWNDRLGVQYADKFFCRKEIQEITFSNLLTTGSPTLQGLTVTFNGHPNFNVQEQTGHVNSFPRQLERNGYRSVFIRSASKYFANENRVFRNMGFSEIIGREDFFDNEALRKYIYGWGLEDRILYQQAADYIEKHRDEKLFVALLGTDTHPPTGQVHYKHLKYPARPGMDGIRQTLGRDTFEWLRAVDRLDHDVALFIDDLEKRGLFDESTLIVVSADHSCAVNNVTGRIPGHSRDNLGRIPLVFFSKQPLPSAPRDVMASQVDIAPSLFHLMGLPREQGWWGASLFDPGRRPYYIGYDKGFVTYRDAGRTVRINTDKPESDADREFLEFFHTVFARKPVPGR